MQLHTDHPRARSARPAGRGSESGRGGLRGGRLGQSRQSGGQADGGGGLCGQRVLVGAFHEPAGGLCDLGFLASLLTYPLALGFVGVASDADTRNQDGAENLKPQAWRDVRWIDRSSVYTEYGDWFVLASAGLVMFGIAILKMGEAPRREG